MKTIAKLFTNRWLVSFLGLLAIALAIWLLGPQLGFGGGQARPLESGSARLIVILLVVVLWALNQLRKVLKARKANQGMVEGLVDAEPSPGPARSEEEVAALRERFEEAVSVLNKSKGKHGRLNLYDLPWYIIIGPPGSGKTTALVNSGLSFPLAERFGREALSGVGGTRNCDWWFTQDAVLLDTAGRYTTQDSDAAVDRSAWEGFLALLKKYRRRRPINGVIVAISLSDLMTLRENERSAHARAIKTRIEELDEYFRIRFPVYVVLTKCDLVAGFMEFFDDLPRHEREQVWGATFPIELSDSEAGAAERFGAELDALLERLNSRLLSRMSQEQDPRRRAAIYGFPRQLASLKQNLQSFIGDVFRGSRYEEAPMLRGVYLTSGTQEGAPIDRLMGAIARTFGLDQHGVAAQGGQGRSYFIKSLLTDVVFSEFGLAGTNRRLESQRAWLQRAAYAGSAVLALLMILGWSISYLSNRAMIRDVQAAATTASEAVDQAAAADEDLTAVLPALEAVKKIPSAYGQPERDSWLMGFGLGQGTRLDEHFELAYRRVLTQLLLPRLMLRLEGQLRAGGPTPDFQYEALKAYLMLDSREHYDSTEVIGWLQFDLQKNPPAGMSPAERDALLAHVAALFKEQPVPLPVPLDASLIEQSQRAVARMPTEQRIYGRLKRRAAAEGLKPFTLFDAAGPQAELVFATDGGSTAGGRIDGFFTREGYRRFFVSQSSVETKALIDESWILGPYAPQQLDTAAVLDRVKTLYLDEFAKQYEDLLLNLKLAAFSTPEEASTILNILSDPVNSPLVKLLAAVADETQLEKRPDQSAPSIADRARGTVQRLQGLLGGAGTATPAAASAASAVDKRLGWVRDLVGGGDPKAAPIQHVVSLLDQLYKFMAVVVTQGGRQGDIPATVADTGRAVVQQIHAEAGRQPQMIRSLLEDAASRTQRLAFTGVRAYLNAQWRSEALPFCKQAIAGRYPIDRRSGQEIRLDDFGRFFGPGGIVDKFFHDYLADYVDMSRKPWRSRTSAAVPFQMSSEALSQFERAAAIKEAFFRSGGNLPSVSFELRPIGMDATINQFTLDLEGQRLTYSFGPLVTKAVQWPGPDKNGEVRIEMTPPASGGSSMLRERGPWAWFKVLDRENVKPADQPEQFQVEFKLGSRKALYQLTAHSAYNPFRFPELEQFSCPESL